MEEKTRIITVMIVDDEERILGSLKKILEIRHFHVITVDRGEKALQIAGEEPVDIVVLDLKMPGLDGEETLMRLKEAHPSLDIIVLTGHGTLATEASCTEKGAFTYLRKPCDVEEILTAMARALHLKCLATCMHD